MNTVTRIDDILNTFTVQIEEAVAEAVTRGFHRALVEADFSVPSAAPAPARSTKAKAKTKPNTKPKKKFKTKPRAKSEAEAKTRYRRDPATVQEHELAVFEAVKKNPDARSEEVQKITGLDRAYVSSSLKSLCAEGQLKWTGKARGTRYSVKGGKQGGKQ